MADLHEAYLADLTGGRLTRGSGNTWADRGDTTDNRLAVEPAFAGQGKSTLGKSHTITDELWVKTAEEAGGERPFIGLRWYEGERLDRVRRDLVVITGADFSELLALAREMVEIKNSPAILFRPDPSMTAQQVEDFRIEFERLIAEGNPSQRMVPPSPPASHVIIDTTVVYSLTTGGEPRKVHQGVRYDEYGGRHEFEVSTVHVDRDGLNRPRLFVNDVLIQRGELYSDGRLICRVGLGEPVG